MFQKCLFVSSPPQKSYSDAVYSQDRGKGCQIIHIWSKLKSSSWLEPEHRLWLLQHFVMFLSVADAADNSQNLTQFRSNISSILMVLHRFRSKDILNLQAIRQTSFLTIDVKSCEEIK